jgi:hypothetical protein
MPDEIILLSPRELLKSATKVKLDSLVITDTGIDVYLSWFDTNGNLVKSEHFPIRDEDYTDIVTAPIVAGDVGKAIGVKLRSLIRAKLISMLKI